MQFQNLFLELVRLADEFRRRRIDYAVCGGLALAIYGFPRATKDIDLLVCEEDLPAVKEAARACGFSITGAQFQFRDGGHLARMIKPLPPGEDILLLDLLLVGNTNREAWNQRVELATTLGTLCVAGAEGLKTMKRRAGRPIDLADLQALEKL